MSETTILKLQNILKNYTNVDLNNINLDTSLEELGITSLDMTEIIFEIETEFDIKLLETDSMEERFNSFKVVRDIVKTIDSVKSSNY